MGVFSPLCHRCQAGNIKEFVLRSFRREHPTQLLCLLRTFVYFGGRDGWVRKIEFQVCEYLPFEICGFKTTCEHITFSLGSHENGTQAIKNERLILKGGCQLYAYILHPAKTSPQSHLVRNANIVFPLLSIIFQVERVRALGGGGVGTKSFKKLI